MFQGLLSTWHEAWAREEGRKEGDKPGRRDEGRERQVFQVNRCRRSGAVIGSASKQTNVTSART